VPGGRLVGRATVAWAYRNDVHPWRFVQAPACAPGNLRSLVASIKRSLRKESFVKLVLRSGVTLGIALLLASPARADVLDFAVVGAAAADNITTELALREPGLREGNPLLQSPAARVGVKGAAVIFGLAGAHHLKTHGHPRAAKVVKIVLVVAWSGAAINNTIRMRSQR
jgi:hypothetical protein